MSASSVGYASMQGPAFTAAHSYLLHPAVAQSALIPQGIEGGAMLASAKQALLPGATIAPGGGVDVAVTSADCAWTSLYTSNALSLHLDELSFLPAKKMGLKPAVTAINAAELVYSMEWQAATPAMASLPFPSRRHALLTRKTGYFNGNEALAGAEISRLLAHHREALANNELGMVSHSAIATLPALTRTPNHVAPAFVRGVLKNLPYELPAMRLQLIDQDAATPAPLLSSHQSVAHYGSFALTAGHQTESSVPWAGDADMYGVSSTAGTLLRPLLTYSTSNNSSGIANGSGSGTISNTFSNPRGTGIITGGLGGLGSMAASWSMGLGSGALVLLGRSGCLAAGAWNGAGGLIHSGGLVVMAKADASFAEDALGAIEIYSADTKLPSTSIMHAAGVQTEARLLKQWGLSWCPYCSEFAILLSFEHHWKREPCKLCWSERRAGCTCGGAFIARYCCSGFAMGSMGICW